MARRYYRKRKRSYYKKRRNNDEGLSIVMGGVFILTAFSYWWSSGLVSVREVFGASFLPLLKLASASILLLGLMAIGFWLGAQVLKLQKREREAKEKELYYQSRKNIKQFLQMDPFDFEKQVAWLYKQLGYQTEVTPGRVDGGIDINLEKGGERIAVQVKRYAPRNYVQRQEVQAFYGSYVDEGYDKGIFVTTSTFSKRSREFADNKNIELVDGVALCGIVEKSESN